MFAHLCLALSLLAAADFTLDNGIRISPQTSNGSSFVFASGYQAGIRNETHSYSGMASVVSHYLQSTAAARSLALSAYGTGGAVDFLDELDRTAIRVSVPEWAAPMILSQTVAFFGETPDKNPDLVKRAIQTVLAGSPEQGSGFRARVEDEIRVGLLGSHPYSHPANGWKADLAQISVNDVVQFFNENYGTDRAFVLTAATLPDNIRLGLSAVPRRTSRKLPEFSERAMNAERTLHFASDESAGGVVFAAPVPGVFYRGWYATLLLDRIVQHTFREKPATTLLMTLDPYYWRVELPVASGLADSVEANLVQDINRLQFSRTGPEDLERARQEAEAYLNSDYAREWFASQGLEARRQEGLQWLRALTADDIRATARDSVALNHLIASWSPKPKQNTVRIENLSASPDSAAVTRASVDLPLLNPVPVVPFPQHNHPAKMYSTPERLTSGVWLAASTVSGVFLSGSEASGMPDNAQRTGSNGTFWNFNVAPDAAVVQSFQKYRADRLLVLATPGSLEAARSLWNNFKSNSRDATVVAPQGKVANIDIPALVVVKSMLDRKLIESGWWHDAALQIDATVGANLEIEGPAPIQGRITEWIKSIGSAPAAESDFGWAREAAIHHLNDVLPDIQILLWQRVHDYTLPDFETITPSHVQDAAKLYFN